LHPQLGGDEKLLPRDAAVLDGAADGFFVEVGGGGVDQAVTGLERVGDDLLGLLRGDLEDAEAEDGHLDAVVQRDGLHGEVPFDHTPAVRYGRGQAQLNAV
jgi:hypothetical protein